MWSIVTVSTWILARLSLFKNWKTLESSTEICSFLGLTYVWGDEQDEAFRILKEKLCNAPVLALPNGPDDFVVYYNASKQGFGSMLMQRGKVIAYASRQLKKHAKNYPPDWNLGAEVFALKFYETLSFMGRKSVVTLTTGSSTSFDQERFKNMRQRRVDRVLSDYACEINYHRARQTWWPMPWSRKGQAQARRSTCYEYYYSFLDLRLRFWKQGRRLPGSQSQ
ncbi:putative reverse transcriptase domain-containing protein [Tanacetum coccineum]